MRRAAIGAGGPTGTPAPIARCAVAVAGRRTACLAVLLLPPLALLAGCRDGRPPTVAEAGAAAGPVSSVAPAGMAVTQTVRATAEPPLPGAVLFRNKGCATCHRHREVPGRTAVVAVGAPDLSDYAGNAEFVRQWLSDPAAMRPGTRMPKLPLSAADIDALAEFVGR
jgi:hypothetical protein